MKKTNGARETKGANTDRASSFLLEALEHEQAGVRVYEIALSCALNAELRKEWKEYLEQTHRHVEILGKLCSTLGLDPETETAGRDVVRFLGHCLVLAMTKASQTGDPEQAQLVAAECVVLAETKDHQNWELIGELARTEPDEEIKAALQEAYDEVEEEEDEHLYHGQGWARELWLAHFGLPALLPPPEEEKDAKTAIDAARARDQREQML